MKKITALCLVFMCVLAALCSCSSGKSIVGKWIDDSTEGIYEYTADGYYYEYVNESFTSDKTRYEVSDGKITYYIDGLRPEDGFSVSYEFDKDGNLVINGEIVYRPLTNPEKED